MALNVTTSLTPNLLAHIYSAAGLSRMPRYQERLGHTLRKEDVEFLRGFAHHFSGRPPVAGGPLFLFLYQIPSYFPAENLDEILGNIDMIIGGLGGGWADYEGLDEDTVRALEVWIPPQLIEYPGEEEGPMLKQVRGALNRLKGVITHSYHGYYEEHWRELRPLLFQRAVEIQKEFDGLPVFDVWSEVLALNFPYKEFVVYLCEARRGGTSLLAEKIAQPYDVALEREVDTIIHEIGIHFIIRPGEYLERGLTVEDFIRHQEEIGRMEEAATCYFKPRVYEGLGLELKEDYHLPLMKIEGEIRRFAEFWEGGEVADVLEGLLQACRF